MMQKLDIELLRRGLDVNISNFEMHTEQDYVTHAIKNHIRFAVAFEQQEPMKFEKPKTWWQHFKAQYFPKWLLRRFPVQWQVHILDIKTVYPHLKTKLPLEMMGKYVAVLVNDRSIGKFRPDTEGLDAVAYKQAVWEKIKDKYVSADKCPCCGRVMFDA